MLEIPKWIKDVIERDGCGCRKCKNAFSQENIISVGVRNGHRDSDVSVAFFEYLCPTCQTVAMIELPFEMTLVEFSTGVLKDMEEVLEEEIAMMENHRDMKNIKKHDPKNGKAKKRSKSCISRAEQRTATKMLNDNEFWVDFLQQIGAPMKHAFLSENSGEKGFLLDD